VFKNDQNQSWCVFTMPLDVSGWTLTREVPMAEYERIIRRIQLYVWMIAGFIFAGGVVVYLFLLRRFMRGVNTLRSAIACLGQGDIAPVAGARFQSREFAIMGRELDKASVALKEQMDTIRRMERERLELEMKDLQNIITPHMILNSITAIRGQASFMGAEVVSDMLIELGEVLRPVVRELRVQWPIQKELEHVGHYSRLMNLRYANNFKMEYHVQEALKEELIPQFTLQPLIENAAQHGGHPKDGLLVTVRVWEDAEWVYLTVANNGNTISSEKAREIRETLRTGKRTHRVGLLNIHNRLAICKGADSAVDIDALPEGGTVVTLRWRKNGPSTNAVLQEGLAFDDRG
jgi:sensor histidine kinase YesM